MSDIKKAGRAAVMVLYMLRGDHKQRAIWAMEMAYKCSTEEATDFVKVIEDIYNLGN